MFNRSTDRFLSAAILALGLIVVPGAAAQAGGQSVEMACAGDYFAFCSQHDPDGKGVRSCMRAHGSQLSKRCVNALVAAGEVSKSEIESKTAKK
jgi:hypothetical protein